MPIATFHISEALLTAESSARILEQASAIYAQELDSPVERTRVFINRYQAGSVAVGGQVCSASGSPAAFFEFIVLEGRPFAQRKQIAERFTALLSDVLAVDAAAIRGRCSQVKPEDWFIAGAPASEIRKREVEARQQEKAHG